MAALAVYTGLLSKVEDKWYVCLTPEDSYEVDPNSDFSEEELLAEFGKQVNFLLLPKWLPKETILYAKLLKRPETWDDVINRFKKDCIWTGPLNELFLHYLKEEYDAPVKKK